MPYLTEDEIRERIKIILEEFKSLEGNDKRKYNSCISSIIGSIEKIPDILKFEDEDKNILYNENTIGEECKILFNNYIQPLYDYVKAECKKLFNIKTFPEEVFSVKSESRGISFRNFLNEIRIKQQRGYNTVNRNLTSLCKNLLKAINKFIKNGWGCEENINKNIDKLTNLNEKTPFSFYDEAVKYANNILNKIERTKNELESDESIKNLIEKLNGITDTYYMRNINNKGRAASNLNNTTNQDNTAKRDASSINIKGLLPPLPSLLENETIKVKKALSKRKMNMTMYLRFINTKLDKDYITKANACSDLLEFINDDNQDGISSKKTTLRNNFRSKTIKIDKDTNKFKFDNDVIYRILITYRICLLYTKTDHTPQPYPGDQEIMRKMKTILGKNSSIKKEKVVDVPNFLQAFHNGFLNNNENLIAYEELLGFQNGEFGKRYGNSLYGNMGNGEKESINKLLTVYRNSLKTGEEGKNKDNNYPFNLLSNYIRYAGKIEGRFKGLSRYQLETIYNLINNPEMSRFQSGTFNFNNTTISYKDAQSIINNLALQKGISTNMTNDEKTSINNEGNQYTLDIQNMDEYQDLSKKIENMPPIAKEATIFAFAMLDNNITDPDKIPTKINANGKILQKTINDDVIKNAFLNSPLLKPYRKNNQIDITKMAGINRIIDKIKELHVDKGLANAILWVYVVKRYGGASLLNRISDIKLLYNGKRIENPDPSFIHMANELKYQSQLSENKTYGPLSELSEFRSWMHRLNEVKGARPTFWC